MCQIRVKSNQGRIENNLTRGEELRLERVPDLQIEWPSRSLLSTIKSYRVARACAVPG